MVAGPYRSHARSEDEAAENLARLNRHALAVIEKGHVPLIGVLGETPCHRPQRVDDRTLPLIRVIDMRMEARRSQGARAHKPR